jgi:hypothetical protein
MQLYYRKRFGYAIKLQVNDKERNKIVRYFVVSADGRINIRTSNERELPMTTITCHNLSFHIEGYGFHRKDAATDFAIILDRITAEIDFITIVNRIRHALDALPAAEVRRIHAGATCIDGDPVDVTAWSELDTIANREASIVITDWHNPDGAYVMISPIV